MTPFEKADKARQLLDDHIFQAVLSDIRNGLIAKLEASAIGDVDTHHETALMLQLLRQIPVLLTKYTEDHEIQKRRDEQDEWLARAKQRLTRPWR